MKMVEKVRFQMKTHFLDLSDPISIICFLSTIKLACSTNRIHEEAAMRVLPFFDKTASTLTLTWCMSAATNITPLIASVHFVESLRQKKLLWSYAEVVNYLLKKFSNTEQLRKWTPQPCVTPNQPVVLSCTTLMIYTPSHLNSRTTTMNPLWTTASINNSTPPPVTAPASVGPRIHRPTSLILPSGRSCC